MREDVMQADYLPNDLATIWKELSTNPLQLSPDQLRHEMKKLQRGLLRRTVVGGAAGLIVIAAFTHFFFLSPNRLQRLGSILTILGAAYILVQLKMRTARAMHHVGETGCTDFYRAELQRQCDFHRGHWFWSRFVVFLPGPIVWCVGFTQANPEAATFIRWEVTAILILAAAAIPLNLRLARKYQRRIDKLEDKIRENIS
jgi:hypothetical protein